MGKSLADAYREASPYLNIGYTLLAAILLFTYLGKKADDIWQITPWGTTGGAITGIVVGFYYLFKLTSRLNRQQKKGDE